MIGTRLRRLRLDRGMTQKELASPRYTHAYVSTIEAGRRHPSREALEHFAAKLGVDAEELETGRPADLVPRLHLRLSEARVALSDGRFGEADKAFRSVAREATRYGFARLTAAAEEGRALWLERRGDMEGAIERYQRAEELLADEPPTARADAVAGKARCFEALGDVRYAIHMLESLLDELERERLHDPGALVRLHASLVDAYLDAGLYDRAAASATALEGLVSRLDDPQRVAQMHMNVARLYLYQGKIEDAERSLQRAEDAYRELDLRTELAGAYLARGYVLSREGRYEAARGQFERAIEEFGATDNPMDLGRTLIELGRLERLEGNVDRAQGAFERALTLLRESDETLLAQTHRELGLVMLERDPDVAEKHFRSAIEIYERAQQVVDLAVTYRALGDLLGSRGEASAACEAYRTGILALEPRL